MDKHTDARAIVDAILEKELPGKTDSDMLSLPVSSVRSLLADAVSRAGELHLANSQRTIDGFMGPVMGACVALEGIADAVDVLLQQDPDEGGHMIAELVKSVQARLETAVEDMEAFAKGRRQP